MKYTIQRIVAQVLLLCLFLSNYAIAEIIGIPPHQVLKIPFSKNSQHFDMAQDNEGVIYISSERGIKIFNGSQWIELEINGGEFVRRVTYAENDKVYFGGRNFFGYIEKDQFGQYGYKIISGDYSDFKDIWQIATCNDFVFFGGLNDIYRYSQKTRKIKHWNFQSRIGGQSCINQQMTLHHRDDNSIRFLKNDEWVDKGLSLLSDGVIYEIMQVGKDSAFILADSDKWQIIKGQTILNFEVDSRVPNLDNYVSLAKIDEDKFVLGSNNGLLTFVDLITNKVETFQLANEWISKIIRTDQGLLILTELEIYYLEWPSPIRVQGKDSGISSNIKNIYKWNNKEYLLSSSGVFLKDEEQLLYQHKLYKRLNWTNKEAWDMMILDDKQAILAESHKLLLVGNDDKITEISDTIYPRRFFPSKYHEGVVFITTELDIRTFIPKPENQWKQSKVFNGRFESFLEMDSQTILATREDNTVFVLNVSDESGQLTLEESKISATDLGLKQSPDFLYGFYKLEGDVFAIGEDEILKLKDGKFVQDDSLGLDKRMDYRDILQIEKTGNGMILGHTYSQFFMKNPSEKLKVMDLTDYLKDRISFVKMIDGEIKILSSGIVISYLEDVAIPKHKKLQKINLNAVIFREDYMSHNLPLKNAERFGFVQGSGSISFEFSSSDVMDDNIEYSYLLAGLDDTWSIYDTNNRLIFTRLPAGDYTLSVRARKNQDVFESELYSFTVKPHWYLTDYAKILWVVLIFVLMLITIKFIINWREKIHEVQKQHLKEIINKKTQELKKANENLQKVAHEDALTGLYNRYYLDKFIRQLTQCEYECLTVLLMDMDYFKAYNDQYGHMAGDQLLIKFASVLTSFADSCDAIAARYGGEEFIILYKNKGVVFAREKAEMISQAIEDQTNNVSVSIGISHSENPQQLKSADEIYNLIDNADKALYQSKKQGRNRINIYDDHVKI